MLRTRTLWSALVVVKRNPPMPVITIRMATMAIMQLA
jgi:hypothetical protein